MFWIPAAVASWPLTGAFGSPAASIALIAELASPSFAANTASTLLFASVRICSMIVCASWLSQPGTCWSATSSQSPASTFGFDGLVVARAEQERVVVLLAAVQHHDRGCRRAERVDHRLEGLGHRPADLDVVEAHVCGAAGAAGVEPVVLDDLDVRVLGGVDDRRARAGVEADEQDDAGAVGDGLLGLRLLLRRVALGVHDVVLDVGRLEGLLEVAPVVRLPPRRGGAVGQEHPDWAVSTATALFVVPSAARGNQRQNCDQTEQEPEKPRRPPP